MKCSLFRNTKQVLLLTLFTLMPISALALPANDSTAKIIGKVHRIYEKNPDLHPVKLSNCEVCLYYQKAGKVDSLLTTTDMEGVFYFRNINPQRIGLRLRHTGYETISGVYDIEAGDNVFYFTLKKEIKTLDAAKVVAEIPLIKRIQDTTVYNTQAIKSVYDESLRGVLEHLPGFSVSGNKISVDGKEVKRTYVNGMLVFGDRVTSAIDALKADEVTQVKVYDELSAVDRHRGNRNAEKERVLDIITKDLILKMDLATAGLSGGADFTGQGRYAAVASVAHHSERLETHLTAAANNIGQEGSLFEIESLPLRVLNQTGPLDSYMEFNGLKASVNKYWKSREFGNMTSFTYCFSNVYSKSAETALTEYLEGETFPARTAFDTLSNRTMHRRHEGRIDLKLDDTPLKSIHILLSGSVDMNESDEFSGNLTLAPAGQDCRIHQASGSQGKNYSVGTDMSWTNNDNVEWRPKLGLGISVSNNNNLSWTVDTITTSFSKRDLHSDGYGRGINGHIVGYLSKRLLNTDNHTAQMDFGGISEYAYSRQKQLSVDEFEVDKPVVNLANSFDYTRHYLKYGILTGIHGYKKGLGSYDATVILNHTYLLSDEQIPASFTKDHGFTYVSSNFMMTGKTYQVWVETDANIPSIEQVSNRVSDANPMVLTAGNPDLKQGYSINVRGQYRPQTKKYNNGASGNFNVSATAAITLNPIVASIRYFSEETVLDQWDGYVAQPGSMLYTYDNSRLPQWSISVKPGYTASVAHNKLQLSVSLSGSHSSGPQNYGGEIVPILDNTADAAIRLSYKPAKRFSLTNSFSAAYLNSARKEGLVSERICIVETLGLTWYILENLKYEMTYRVAGYKYLSGIGSDHYSHYLNAGLDLILLKDRSLTIGIAGCDLLNSGSLYKTTVTSEKVTQTWTPTYGRNLMFKIVYTLRSK